MERTEADSAVMTADEGQAVPETDAASEPDGMSDQTPVSTPEPPASLTNEEEDGGAPSWHKSLPGSLRGNKSLLGYATIGDAAEALVKLQAKPEGIQIPGEGATPVEIHEFYRKLGRPESPEGYGLTKPDNWPEGLKWDEEAVLKDAERAHRAGLSVTQARVLARLGQEEFIEAYRQRQENLARQKDAHNKTLLAWANGDEQKVATMKAEARRALRLVGSPELEQLFDRLGISEHPLVIQSYTKAAAALTDDRRITGELGARVTKDEQKRKIDDFYKKGAVNQE